VGGILMSMSAASGSARATISSISVGDDGRGGASLASSRGLRGLADRIEVTGGTLSVASPPGGPTRISAEIPTP